MTRAELCARLRGVFEAAARSFEAIDAVCGKREPPDSLYGQVCRLSFERGFVQGTLNVLAAEIERSGVTSKDREGDR